MHNDFVKFFHEAENHYLQPMEMTAFKLHIDTLKDRLATYKLLRDHELEIFQTVADTLLIDFPDESELRLERALKQGIAVMRYGAMAMLLNNQEFFQHRLLEWLTELVNAHELQTLEKRLFETLQRTLPSHLDLEQIKLLQPFLDQAQTLLLTDKPLSQVPALS